MILFPDTRKCLVELFKKVLQTKDAFMQEFWKVYDEAKQDYEQKKANREPKK